MANSSLKRSQDALQADTSVSYLLQISSTRNYYLYITKDVSVSGTDTLAFFKYWGFPAL